MGRDLGWLHTLFNEHLIVPWIASFLYALFEVFKVWKGLWELLKLAIILNGAPNFIFLASSTLVIIQEHL